MVVPAQHEGQVLTPRRAGQLEPSPIPTIAVIGDAISMALRAGVATGNQILRVAPVLVLKFRLLKSQGETLLLLHATADSSGP